VRGLPGTDHFPWVGDTEAVLGEVEEILTGVRHGPEPDPALATVMFHGHRARATETGRGAGRRALAREHLTRFRGHEIDTAEMDSSRRSTGTGTRRALCHPRRA
jgi:hypothetical protein